MAITYHVYIYASFYMFIYVGGILEAMWKARQDGCSIKVRYGKVLLCGASGAGKTNFLNLLLNETFQSHHISTEVINPQQVTIAIKAKISTCDKDSEVTFNKMNINDEIFQLMSYLPKQYTVPYSQQSVQSECNSPAADHIQLYSQEHTKRKESFGSVSEEGVVQLSPQEHTESKNDKRSVFQKHVVQNKFQTITEEIISSTLASNSATSDIATSRKQEHEEHGHKKQEHEEQEHGKQEHEEHEHKKQEHEEQEHEKQEHEEHGHKKQEHEEQEHRKQEHEEHGHKKQEYEEHGHKKQEHEEHGHKKQEHEKQVHERQEYKMVWDLLTFMDTGGQPQFISMLPAVNSFAMITFIVHKMTGGRKSLDDKFMVQHGNKQGNHSFTPYEHECTYYQLIKTLMSYASVNLFSDKSFFKDIKISCNQPSNTSISFIGTHSKDVSVSDITEIDEVLTDIVEYSDSKNIKRRVNEKYNYLIPIDNKQQCVKSKILDKSLSPFKFSGPKIRKYARPSKYVNRIMHRSSGFDRSQGPSNYSNIQYTNPSIIRTYIHEWMMKQDIYTVPIQWLLLELEIRKVCELKQCSFITYNDVVKIGREKNLGNESFIKNGLRFHHLFGVLLYFEELKGMCELVISNHQWLFEQLSEIVKYSFKDDTSSDHRDLCKGLFKESMLNKLNIDEDFKKSGIDVSINPNTAFLEMLQHLLIIAPLNEDATQYFMPSLLKSCNINDLHKNIPGKNSFIPLTSDTESLLIQFESADATDSFPRGFLCFLVVQLIRSTDWELYKRNVHDNFLTFCKVNGPYYVTLVDRIFFLEVFVTHGSSNMMPIHHEILDTIRKALFAVMNRLNIEMKLKCGFICKMCQDTEEVHMTYLSKNDCDYCFCANQVFTKLEASHKVWLGASSAVCTVSALRIFIIHI